MEILYVRKTKTISAIQVNIDTTSLNLNSFFYNVGFILKTVRIIEEAPFFLNSKNVILVFEQKGVENTIRCKYTDYICLQKDVLLVKGKSDFESEFEPIEPILDNIAHQTNSMAI
jgi:hypothetical protein